MTVGELIKHLEAFPADDLVVRGDSFKDCETIHRPRRDGMYEHRGQRRNRRISVVIVE